MVKKAKTMLTLYEIGFETIHDKQKEYFVSHLMTEKAQ